MMVIIVMALRDLGSTASEAKIDILPVLVSEENGSGETRHHCGWPEIQTSGQMPTSKYTFRAALVITLTSRDEISGPLRISSEVLYGHQIDDRTGVDLKLEV